MREVSLWFDEADEPRASLDAELITEGHSEDAWLYESPSQVG